MLGKFEGRRRRVQDDWMASLAQWTRYWLRWTWVWASSRRWWRAGKPGVLQSLGSQRVGHNLVTEQQWGNDLFSCPLIYVSVCLFIYPSVCLSIHPSVHPSIYLAFSYHPSSLSLDSFRRTSSVSLLTIKLLKRVRILSIVQWHTNWYLK